MTGAALAAFGGVLMAPYSGVIYAEMGMEFAILAFIVVVIGGMGSFPGSLFAAILVGLAGSFMAYYVPVLSLAVNMIIMVDRINFPSARFVHSERGEDMLEKVG